MTAQEIAAVRAKAVLDAVYLEWIRYERAISRNDRFPRPAGPPPRVVGMGNAAGEYLRLASRPVA